MQYFERLIQTQMSFLKNDKKLDCKQRRLNANRKDPMQCKQKNDIKLDCKQRRLNVNNKDEIQAKNKML